MNGIRYRTWCLLALAASTISLATPSENDNLTATRSHQEQSFEEQALLDTLEDTPVKFTPPAPRVTRDGQGTTRQISNIEPHEILDLLCKQGNLNNILAIDFFAYTYPLAYRTIQSYPALFAWTPDRSSFTMKLFYQQTTNLFPTCLGIKGYLNLFNGDFIRAIDLPIIRDSGISVPDLIGLLQGGRVEQRRAGFFFDGWKRFRDFNFGASLPLYVVARNYNLPVEDQHEIKSQNIFTTCTNDKAQEKAYHKYAVETRFGIGDLQLNAAYDIFNVDCVRLPIGIRITAPTETTFKSGFIGSDFKKIDCRGCLNFTELADDFLNGSNQEKEAAKNTCITFSQCVANHLGAMLLATDLGLEKRWQIGMYTEPTFRLNEKVTLCAQAQINCWLGKQVKRFFKQTTNCADFADALFNPNNFPPAQREAMSQEAIDFLQDRLTNDLFPCSYCTYLKPQWEGQFTLGPWFQFTDNWSLFVGYDWWHRSPECATLITQTACCPTSLQTSCGLLPALTQNKMVLKGQYNKFGEYHDFALTLATDISMTSHGIGSDYTGALAFAWSF